MKQHFGGTFLGFIIGVVFGLAAALGVAVYVTKVPIPFVNKGQTRSADQDAAESKKNKDWDPNAPLYGKNPARPNVPASAPVAASAETTPAGAATPGPAVATPVPAVAGKVEPAKPEVKADPKAATSADPLGDLAKAKAAATSTAAEPFSYFVQVGAFRTPEDAEAQRAKLSISGFEAKVSEREQSGRAVFRVRVGPFDKREDADKAKEKLDGAGMDTALVRVQR